MADIKWIKQDLDMFDNRKIKLIRKREHGDIMVLIWIMLLHLAGKCNEGGLVTFTDDIPYTPDLLAEVLEDDEPIVSEALDLFEQFGMIEYDSDGFMYITSWEEHQNTEAMEDRKKKNRDRQKRFRDSHKEQQPVTETLRNTDSNAPVTDNGVTHNASVALRNTDSNVSVTLRNATDKNRIEENRKEKNDDDDDLYQIRDDHEAIFSLWKKCGFPLSERVMDQLVELYGKHGLDKLLESIKATADASPKGGVMQYLNKVLDNYGKPRQAKQEAPAKVVVAQQFTQRDYTPTDDYIESLIMGG